MKTTNDGLLTNAKSEIRIYRLCSSSTKGDGPNEYGDGRADRTSWSTIQGVSQAPEERPFGSAPDTSPDAWIRGMTRILQVARSRAQIPGARV